MKYDVDLLVTVRVEIPDDDPNHVIARCTENEDGWRETFYDLYEDGDVLHHLALNLGVRNWSISSLDGWADCTDADATGEIIDARLEGIS